MASLTGSFPAFRHRLLSVAFGGLWAAGNVAGALPDYAREALGKFSTAVPAGWAYTLTTIRNVEARTTARFEPAKPPAEQWSLRDFNGRPPTEKEIAQYARARAGDNSAGPQGTFQRSDIDPGSLELVKEDAERAEFTGAFRAESVTSDRMLGHLRLRLTINKRRPHVEKFTLTLPEPYSPVLGVKMRELLVEMSFAPPGPDLPSLPVRYSSHFVGRIFFFGMVEDITLDYTDYARADSPANATR